MSRTNRTTRTRQPGVGRRPQVGRAGGRAGRSRTQRRAAAAGAGRAASRTALASASRSSRLGVGRAGVGVEPHDLPAARRGEPLACVLAQVVGVRLGVGRERADDGGGVGVDVGERRHGGRAARGARAATQGAHGGRRYPSGARQPLKTRGAAAPPTVAGVSAPRRRRRRDRRGRGAARPAGAAARAAGRLPDAALRRPRPRRRRARGGALARPARGRGLRRRGGPAGRRRGGPAAAGRTRSPRRRAARAAARARRRVAGARIVIYRRPLELRAVDRDDLEDLVHDIVVEEVAQFLGMDPAEVDPDGYGPQD